MRKEYPKKKAHKTSNGMKYIIIEAALDPDKMEEEIWKPIPYKIKHTSQRSDTYSATPENILASLHLNNRLIPSV